VLAAVAQNGHALDYASEELKADMEVVLAAIAQNGCALDYASKELKGDKEFVLAAVAQNGCALAYASKELKADKEVVLAAVAQNGYALMYASKELKGDKEVVLAAVAQNGRALHYPSAVLQAHRDRKERISLRMEVLRQRKAEQKAQLLQNVQRFREGQAQNPPHSDLASDVRDSQGLLDEAEHGLLHVATRTRSRQFISAASMLQKCRYCSGTHGAMCNVDEKTKRAYKVENLYKLGELKARAPCDSPYVCDACWRTNHRAWKKREQTKAVVSGVGHPPRPAQDGHALTYASEELKADKEIVPAVPQNGHALQQPVFGGRS